MEFKIGKCAILIMKKEKREKNLRNRTAKSGKHPNC